MVLRVPGRLVIRLEAGDRVRQRVRDVHPRGPEAYPRERGAEHHRPPRFYVFAVLNGSTEVLPAVLQGFGRPHIRYGVGPLMRRPLARVFGLLARVVGLA